MTKNILGIILFAAGLVVLFYWVGPRWEKTRALALDKAELEATLERFQKLKKIRDELLSQYNAIPKENLDKLFELLPSGTQIGLLLVNLEGLSKENGMVLKRIDVTERKEEGIVAAASSVTFEKLPFNFSVSGSYESFRSFLRALEANLRLMDIEGLVFTAGRSNSYEFSLQASAYWQKR